MELFWHRQDLRISDNRGLAHAADRGTVAPVFVFDQDVLDHAGPPRVAYMLDALASLRDEYRERGGDLLIGWGDPADVLSGVSDALGAERVVWNRDYSGLARERDARVRTALDDVGIEREAHHDDVHHKPDSIRTNAGDPYSVYTYYWKKWQDRAKEDAFAAPDDAVADVESGTVPPDYTRAELPSLNELGFETPEADIQPAGTEPARRRLEAFCGGDITRYESTRDDISEQATSRLSADLKFGTIGVREVYERTQQALDSAGDDEREEVREFQGQLAWREFYTQVLYHNPEVVTENYKDYENPIEWREDPEALQAWKDGETGYPIVDAGMRQLREEAYMHNRVRMIVASFLTKDLQLDWRRGYEWFRQKLADHNTANDNGGWQWAASTGTDAQPYFRIFNPMTQGERHDPDAEYIKTYVPELADTEPDVIHSWHELSLTQRRRSAPDYPDPIVDHSKRREETLSMFEQARGQADD